MKFKDLFCNKAKIIAEEINNCEKILIGAEHKIRELCITFPIELLKEELIESINNFENTVFLYGFRRAYYNPIPCEEERNKRDELKQYIFSLIDEMCKIGDANAKKHH